MKNAHGESETWHQWVLGIVTALLLAVSLFASVPLLLVLPWLLIAPLVGFTFTEPLDFAPLALTLITFAALSWRSARRPYPESWVRTVRALTWAFTVGPPAALLSALYLLSWRGSALRGHWPRYMADDPKYIGAGDALYQNLFDGVSYVGGFAGWGLWTLAALLLHLRAHISPRHVICLGVVFVASWLAFIYEPGGRFWWWLD